MHEESGATRTRMAPPCFLSPNTCHLQYSGGGEIRTPVLHAIFRSVYARVPSIDFSGRWPTGLRRTDESAEISPASGRRTVGPARICVT